VTVSELQILLSDLAKFLRNAASSAAAAELEYVSTRLTPFKDYKVKAFADFLGKADQIVREGAGPKKAPTKAGSGKRKTDPAALDAACQSVLQLYDKAIDPNVTLEQITAAVQSLEDLDPAKAKLVELAQKMGYSQKFKTKADVLKAIRQKIMGRKGAFDRVDA
jgi:hypothetical protein